MKTFNKVFTVIVLLFLYIPMIVLGAASLNAGTDPAVWEGFTLSNYGELFRRHPAAAASEFGHRGGNLVHARNDPRYHGVAGYPRDGTTYEKHRHGCNEYSADES